MQISTRVKPPTKNELLLDYMSGRFTYRPREVWAELIADGSVLFKGERATAQTLVSAGDVITTTIPDPEPPDANYNYTVVYEDDHMLAVNKPANLRVHGRGRYIHANLIHHIRHVRTVGPRYPHANLINRLDANTTGLVLLSKTQEMLVAMQSLFQNRQIEKTYLAIVRGIPAEQGGTIDSPIGLLPAADGVYRYGNGPTAQKLKEAVTTWRLIKRLPHNRALVELKPKTGRTHQLRVHMAAIGHPLAGDAVYQLTDEEYLLWCDEPEQFPNLGFHRHALHCWKYNLVHPISHEPFEVKAPPADFE